MYRYAIKNISPLTVLPLSGFQNDRDQLLQILGFVVAVSAHTKLYSFSGRK